MTNQNISVLVITSISLLYNTKSTLFDCTKISFNYHHFIIPWTLLILTVMLMTSMIRYWHQGAHLVGRSVGTRWMPRSSHQARSPSKLLAGRMGWGSNQKLMILSITRATLMMSGFEIKPSHYKHWLDRSTSYHHLKFISYLIQDCQSRTGLFSIQATSSLPQQLLLCSSQFTFTTGNLIQQIKCFSKTISFSCDKRYL